MPSKKKKYNARFPAGRIKKIMQSDEEVGKVAQAVPIIILGSYDPISLIHLLPRTLELFVESMLRKTLKITNSRNAKTLSPSHMKQCIMSEQRFDFLRELVRNIPDISVAEEAANYNDDDSSPEDQYPDSDTPYDLSMPSTSVKAARQNSVVSLNGHNGAGQHTEIHHENQRNYLKRSFSSNPSTSVIRHTTGISQTNVDCLPAKVARSDLTPVPQQLLGQQHQQQQHPRLKHQSYSMPTHFDNNDKPNTNTYLEQLRSPSQQTAIPAPIVNIDYCSKPVVKIDYSNLAGVATANNAVAAPLSAPANISNMSSKNSAFNFSAEPVINIDLSNIVTSPATATISIGTTTLTTPLPPILPSSASAYASSPIHKTKALPTKVATADQQSRNSKALGDEPLQASSVTVKATTLAAAVAAATTMSATMSTAKNDSYLEMDEDYDNI